MDMSFIYAYKPVLYPMSTSAFDQQAFDDELSETTVPSLVNLCCQKIVQDSTMTQVARDTVPVSLCESLLIAALRNDRDRSVEQLVAGWPWRHLSLAKHTPAMFGLQPSPAEHMVPLCGSELQMSEHMRRAVKQTTCLAHTFIECLKKRTATKLRYLDLTGYPAAEVIVNYLASHVLLVFNEVRQQEIIRVYDTITQDLPDDQRRQYAFSSTLPDEQYVLCLDAIIQSEDAHMELCRALRISRTPSSRLRLRIGKLDMSSLGLPRTVVLLEQLEPEFLTGLSIPFNGISNEGLNILGPVLGPFVHLTGFDLSSNEIVLTSSEGPQPAAHVLADILASMPRLQRLNLSDIRMRDCVGLVLGKISEPLSLLRLAGCGLRRGDLEWLATSRVVSRLEQLDISGNNLTPNIDTIRNLLLFVANTLTMFEAEESELGPLSLSTLLQTFQLMPQLRFINICTNVEIGASATIDILEKLIPVQRLRTFRLSAPTDLALSPDDGSVVHGAMSHNDEEAFREARKNFAVRLSDLLARLCHAHNRPIIRLLFKL